MPCALIEPTKNPSVNAVGEHLPLIRVQLVAIGSLASQVSKSVSK